MRVFFGGGGRKTWTGERTTTAWKSISFISISLKPPCSDLFLFFSQSAHSHPPLPLSYVRSEGLKSREIALTSITVGFGDHDATYCISADNI